MEKILVDTDVIVDFLRGYRQRIKGIFRDIEDKKIKAYITWINVVEIYSGMDFEKKEAIIKKLFSLFEILSQDWKSAKLAGKLRRNYGLGLADAIIASLAITHDLKCFTFNKKDFKKIREIKFYID